MKLYVDSKYYLDTFGGKMMTTMDVIDKNLKLAQEKIDSITYNRIVAIGFDNLTEFQQEKIKDAICYQAEYILNNGFNDEDKEVMEYVLRVMIFEFLKIKICSF